MNPRYNKFIKNNRHRSHLRLFRKKILSLNLNRSVNDGEFIIIKIIINTMNINFFIKNTSFKRSLGSYSRSVSNITNAFS